MPDYEEKKVPFKELDLPRKLILRKEKEKEAIEGSVYMLGKHSCSLM